MSPTERFEWFFSRGRWEFGSLPAGPVELRAICCLEIARSVFNGYGTLREPDLHGTCG